MHKQLRQSCKKLLANTFLDKCPGLQIPTNDYFTKENASRENIREWIELSATIFSDIPASCVNLKSIHKESFKVEQIETISTLKKDGITIINNFFDAGDCIAMQELFRNALKIENATRQINRNMGNLFYTHDVLKNLSFKEKNKLDQVGKDIAQIWNQKYTIKLENIMNSVHGFNVSESCTLKDAVQIQSKYAITAEDEWEDRVTCWHIDRFVPVFKAFFFPFPCTSISSPFGYSLRSHIIDDDYIEIVSDLLFNRFTTGQMIGWRNDNFDYKEIEVDSNSLIIAATNGMHRRTPFKASGWRHTLRFNFYNSNTLRANINRQKSNSFI